MLKILRKREEIALEEQFLLLSTIFYYLMLDFYLKTGIRLSLRDKRLFEITEVEITRVDCISKSFHISKNIVLTHFLFLFHFNPFYLKLLIPQSKVSVYESFLRVRFCTA